MTEVLEGEVQITHRRRQRNDVRYERASVDVLPPDVETKVVALRTLPVAVQAVQVTEMLQHAKSGLLVAMAAQDLPSIVEWKAKAGAIQEMAKQLQLGKDMQQDAAEFVRRAERGLGVAIREGQARGEIRTRGQGGGNSTSSIFDQVPSAESFAQKSELQGQSGHEGIYAMTDGVSDEDFEQALTEAREEENLSRANVARKARARTENPIPVADPRPALKKSPRARKTVELLAITLGNLALSVVDIEPGEVDREQLREQLESIDQSLGEIRGFIRKVNKQ